MDSAGEINEFFREQGKTFLLMAIQMSINEYRAKDIYKDIGFFVNPIPTKLLNITGFLIN